MHDHRPYVEPWANGLLKHQRRLAVLTMASLWAALGAAEVRAASKPRLLTEVEMDQLTVGAAASASAAATAQTIGSAPDSGTLASTIADAGGSPIPGAPFLNYATAQTLSYGSDTVSVQVTSASRVFVDGGNGGAGIAATASADGTTDSKTHTQWYAVSTNHADLVFGTVAASACCGPQASAQVTADLSGGGPYISQYAIRRQPVTQDRIEQTIDVAVVSSTLPIADPARIAAAVSARVYSKY